MSKTKLFNLKEWLTVPDAAKHLSIVFGEEVGEADVLRLALDGYLKLSVNFVNHAEARCGKIVSIDEAEFEEVSSLDGQGTVRLYDGPILFSNGRQTGVIKLENTVVGLAGIFDLPMIGSERLDVEHAYQMMTNGPEITLETFDGSFVERTDGAIFQLQESFEDNKYASGSNARLEEIKAKIAVGELDKDEVEKLSAQHKEDRKKYLAHRDENRNNDYYPAGGLPRDAVYVVRTEELRNFEQRISENDEAGKPLKTTERNTLLTIIAALCDYSAIDPLGRGTAGQIAKMSEELGAPVTDDTIRKMLTKIPDALERRKK